MSQKPLKKFKIDESFEPCPVLDCDELCPNGIFVFNITKMKEFILSRPDLFVPEDIDVKGGEHKERLPCFRWLLEQQIENV